MLVSLDFTTLVANTVESQSGSDGSPYEKKVDAKGRDAHQIGRAHV